MYKYIIIVCIILLITGIQKIFDTHIKRMRNIVKPDGVDRVHATRLTQTLS